MNCSLPTLLPFVYFGHGALCLYIIAGSVNRTPTLTGETPVLRRVDTRSTPTISLIMTNLF